MLNLLRLEALFLGLMLAGISYAVMIGTESYLLQEMWGIVL